VTVETRVVGPVAVAKTLVRRGEVFTAQNLQEEMRDITTLSSHAAPTVAECTGQMASQTVTAGRMLTSRLVHIPPVFLKGESVPLVSRDGNVHVAIQAVARRDGRIGDVIPVWNPVNRRMVHALVQQDGTLKLMAEGG
jgi:flagellar basal body P-ring formation protein FlgA